LECGGYGDSGGKEKISKKTWFNEYQYPLQRETTPRTEKVERRRRPKPRARERGAFDSNV